VLDDDLRSRLMPGERILWSGRPRQGLLLTGRDIFLVPFSLIFCGGTIVWEAAVLGLLNRAGAHSHAPLFFALWGVPFVLLGLYLVFGRFITDASIRRRTIYGVTDKRVRSCATAVQQVRRAQRRSAARKLQFRKGQAAAAQ